MLGCGMLTVGVGTLIVGSGMIEMLGVGKLMLGSGMLMLGGTLMVGSGMMVMLGSGMLMLGVGTLIVGTGITVMLGTGMMLMLGSGTLMLGSGMLMLGVGTLIVGTGMTVMLGVGVTGPGSGVPPDPPGSTVVLVVELLPPSELPLSEVVVVDEFAGFGSPPAATVVEPTLLFGPAGGGAPAPEFGVGRFPNRLPSERSPWDPPEPLCSPLELRSSSISPSETESSLPTPPSAV